MPVSHDPANRARMSYPWRDARYYLVVAPSPLVLLISNTVSEGQGYATAEQAETAFWEMIVNTIFVERTNQDPYVRWPGVEIAVVPDPMLGAVHVAERTHGGCQAWPLPTAQAALNAYFARLRKLIPEITSSNAGPPGAVTP